MKKATVEFKILSYWHAGSGQGQGGNADALVLKDADGLPYLPGRTVKGLLREGVQASEDSSALPEGTSAQLFGKPAGEGAGQSSEPGLLRFQDACMDPSIAPWLASPESSGCKAQLFMTIASTSLDSTGTAKLHTLRTSEVCVPLSLFTEVAGPDDPAWIDQLAQAAGMVRALGSHRHRGLGRCEVHVAVAKEVRS